MDVYISTLCIFQEWTMVLWFIVQTLVEWPNHLQRDFVLGPLSFAFGTLINITVVIVYHKIVKLQWSPNLAYLDHQHLFDTWKCWRISFGSEPNVYIEKSSQQHIVCSCYRKETKCINVTCVTSINLFCMVSETIIKRGHDYVVLICHMLICYRPVPVWYIFIFPMTRAAIR